MKRRNILATHLSRKRAEITDSWVNTTGRREENPVIELDFDECREDFEQTRGWEEECDRTFSGHPNLEVIYEELADDYGGQMKRVFEFLGLENHDVRPEIYKQSSRTLRESIANYPELKRSFEGTSWAPFFED
jgi:LPS sulfotransferase NodH